MTLVLTLLGPDRTGIVEAIADQIASHDGNWLESRMCRLGGQFAGILSAELPETRRAALDRALDPLRAAGFEITLRAGAASGESRASRLVSLEVVGNDRPGIVRQISQLLAERGINVETFESGRESAAMSGQLLFSAKATLALPESVSIENLRHALERLADDLMVTIQLAPLKPAAV